MEIIKSFLGYFGDPLVLILDEKGIDPDYYKNSKTKKDKCYSIDECMYINKTNPFGVHFTPNGNYGNNVVKGSSLKGKRSKTTPGPSPHLNSFVIDCDYKYFDGEKEDFLDAIIAVCVELSIVPTFLSCTTPPQDHKNGGRIGGYHLYFLLSQTDRKSIEEKFAKDFFDLNTYIQKKFPGEDGSPMAISSCIRLPISNHWKYSEINGEPNPSGFLKYGYLENGILKLSPYIGNDEGLTFIGLQNVKAAFQYMRAERTDAKEVNKINENYIQTGVEDINKIPFEEVIKRLPDRIYKGVIQKFSLDGTRVLINGESNNGYKFRKEKNVLNCFSSKFHPREERPCGQPIHFIRKYFFGDAARIAEFVLKNFGISLADKSCLSQGEEIVSTFNLGNNSIMFSNKQVILQNSDAKKQDRSPIFRRDLEFVGISYTNINDDKLSELERDRKVYIFKSGTEIYLREQYPSKKGFNAKYAKYGCHFFGSDDDLGIMFTIFDHAEDLKTYTCIGRDGYYGDYFVVGGNIIGKAPDNHIVYMNDKAMFNLRGDTIKLKTFMSLYRGLYSDVIAIPTFLTTIAMAGLDYWTQGNEQQLGPQMLLTGITRSGKSTICYLLKSMLGLTPKTREFSFSAITADALAKNSTSASLIFIEEVTGKAKMQTEDCLREVINKNKMSKGTIGGMIDYRLRSPIFGLGERGFSSESLNNRFCNIICDKKYKKGSASEISMLMQKTCYEEIYKRYIKGDKDKCLDMYKEKVELLIQEGYDHREAGLRAYSLAVNEMFKLGIDEALIIECVDHHRKFNGSTLESNKEEPHTILLKVILKGYQLRKVTCMFNEGPSSNKFSFMFDEAYFQENKFKLLSAIDTMKETFTETESMITAQQDGFDIMYRNGKGSTVMDEAMHATFSPLIKMLKGSIIETRSYG